MLFQSYFSMGFQTNPSGEIGNDLPVLPKPSRANCSRAEKPSRNWPTFQVYLFFFLCNCYDIPISMDCWENRHRKPIEFSEKSGFDFSFSQVTRHFLAMPKCCGRHAGAFRCAVSGGTFQSLENCVNMAMAVGCMDMCFLNESWCIYYMLCNMQYIYIYM